MHYSHWCSEGPFCKKKHQLCSRVDEVCLSICLCGIQCFALINTLVSGLKVIIGSLRPTQKHCCIYSSFVTSQAKGLFRLSGLKEGDS